MQKLESNQPSIARKLKGLKQAKPALKSKLNAITTRTRLLNNLSRQTHFSCAILICTLLCLSIGEMLHTNIANAGLGENGSIGSYIWVDTNNNGLQDPSESSLPGVQVSIVDLSGDPIDDIFGNPVPTITTDGTGIYFFDGIPEGTYYIELIPSIFYVPSDIQSTGPINGRTGLNIVENDSNIASSPSEGVYRSGAITMTGYEEPIESGNFVGDSEDGYSNDEEGNMTVDFGFYPNDGPESNTSPEPLVCNDGSAPVILNWADVSWNGGDASNTYANVNGSGHDITLNWSVLNASFRNGRPRIANDSTECPSITGNYCAASTANVRNINAQHAVEILFDPPVEGLDITVGDLQNKADGGASPNEIIEGLSLTRGPSSGLKIYPGANIATGQVRTDYRPITSDEGDDNSIRFIWDSSAYINNVEFAMLNDNSGPRIYGNALSFNLSGIAFCPATSGIDYGDAPASYGAPQNTIVNGVSIGSAVDGETSALFSANALGDDQNNLDDDDGITFVGGASGRPGESVTVNYTVYNTVHVDDYLRAWIDWDQSGNFQPSRESIIPGNRLTFLQSPASQTGSFDFTIPDDAACGTTYARFRLASDSGFNPVGNQSAGETEDYTFEVNCEAVEVTLSGGGAMPEDGGTKPLTASISQPIDSDVIVFLSYSGEATYSTDYLASSTITIPRGETDTTIIISARNDSEYEGEESLIVDIDSVTNATEAGEQQAVYSIYDDEDAPEPFVCDMTTYASAFRPQYLYTLNEDFSLGDRIALREDLVINGLGYNIEDNFIYGTVVTPGDTDPSNTELIRLHADGRYNILGKPIGNAPWSPSSASGTMDTQGNWYGLDHQDASNPHLLKVDVSTMTLSRTPITGDFANPKDLIFSLYDGGLYGIGSGELRRIGLDGQSAILRTQGAILPEEAGGAWSDSRGNLFFYSNQEAPFALFQVDFSEDPPMVIDMGPVSPTSNFDAAACFPPDLLKRANPTEVVKGGKTTYTFTLFNGNATAQNFDFIDALPAGLNFDLGSLRPSRPGGGIVTEFTNGRLRIDGISVPSGIGNNKIVFSVDVLVDIDAPTGEIPNQAQLIDRSLTVQSDDPRTAQLDDPTVIIVLADTYDHGDAPLSYSEALHRRTSAADSLRLGTLIDWENLSMSSSDALLDDTNDLDDEDGISFLDGEAGSTSSKIVLHPSKEYMVQADILNTAYSTAELRGWIDFNGNGEFDLLEIVLIESVPQNSINQTITSSIPVPADAACGPTFGRFRLMADGVEDPTTPSDDGEVEDYFFEIDCQTDLELTLTSPISVPLSAFATITGTVTNYGPNSAKDMTIIIDFPTTLEFVELRPQNGWDCNLDLAALGIGKCEFSGLASGSSKDAFVFKGRVPGTYLEDSIIVSGMLENDYDQTSDNNSPTASILVDKVWVSKGSNHIDSVFLHAKYADDGSVASTADLRADFQSDEIVKSLIQVPLDLAVGLKLASYPQLTTEYCAAVPTALGCDQASDIITGTILYNGYTVDTIYQQELSAADTFTNTGESLIASAEDISLMGGRMAHGRFVDNDPRNCKHWQELFKSKFNLQVDCLTAYYTYQPFFIDNQDDFDLYHWSDQELVELIFQTSYGRNATCSASVGQCQLLQNTKPGIYSIQGAVENDIVFLDPDLKRLGDDMFKFSNDLEYKFYIQIIAPFVQPEQ